MDVEAGHAGNRVEWLRAAKQSREAFDPYAHFYNVYCHVLLWAPVKASMEAPSRRVDAEHDYRRPCRQYRLHREYSKEPCYDDHRVDPDNQV